MFHGKYFSNILNLSVKCQLASYIMFIFCIQSINQYYHFGKMYIDSIYTDAKKIVRCNNKH